MPSHLTIIILTTLISLNTVASEAVSKNYLGRFKLLSIEKGDCAEFVELKEKVSQTYSLWITYKDIESNFIGKEKFDELNQPRQNKTDQCPKAGPIIHFCKDFER